MRQLEWEMAPAKAVRTAKWATTMTKWRIGFETGGKRFGSPTVKPARRWQLVSFPGPAERESAGIVDLMAVHKNHAVSNTKFKRGDLFEIILIQIKDGSAPPQVERYSKTPWNVVLAERVKGDHLKSTSSGRIIVILVRHGKRSIPERSSLGENRRMWLNAFRAPLGAFDQECNW